MCVYVHASMHASVRGGGRGCSAYDSTASESCIFALSCPCVRRLILKPRNIKT